MEIESIINEEQYESCLKRIYDLMQKNLKHNSKLSEELENLSILVEKYEKEFHLLDNKMLKKNKALIYCYLNFLLKIKSCRQHKLCRT